MSQTLYECNAIIQSASIGLDRGSFLTAWVHLDYGGSGQGFGGYVLGGTPDARAGEHYRQKNLAAEFIVRVLSVAGVEKWSDLPGKTVRVRKVGDSWGDIVAIGHIVKDDRWFDPKQAFARMEVQANVEQAVRDALSKLDSTAVPDEPGTDRFHVDTYSDGEVSVYGQFVQVHTEDGSNREVVRMSAQTEIGWRDLRVSLKTARELADALGVLFENIKHGGAA